MGSHSIIKIVCKHTTVLSLLKFSNIIQWSNDLWCPTVCSGDAQEKNGSDKAMVRETFCSPHGGGDAYIMDVSLMANGKVYQMPLLRLGVHSCFLTFIWLAGAGCL